MTGTVIMGTSEMAQCHSPVLFHTNIRKSVLGNSIREVKKGFSYIGTDLESVRVEWVRGLNHSVVMDESTELTKDDVDTLIDKVSGIVMDVADKEIKVVEYRSSDMGPLPEEVRRLMANRRRAVKELQR